MFRPDDIVIWRTVSYRVIYTDLLDNTATLECLFFGNITPPVPFADLRLEGREAVHLISTIGGEFKNNVQEALELKSVPYTCEEGSRPDMHGFYVEENILDKAQKAIEDFYEKADKPKP